MKKDFINIMDHSAEFISEIIETAINLKKVKGTENEKPLLKGKTLAMYFQKASLRTRISQDAAMTSLGGGAIYMDFQGGEIFDRESLPDQARVMGRFADIISMRTFSHQEIEDFAAWCPVPVVNTLSDASHPTQALADAMTMIEYMGEAKGKELVYVGDGNNVARSLAAVCGKLGIKFKIASPEGYHLGEEFLDYVRGECPGADLQEMVDPIEAVKNADAIYTDVWASMGQEEETELRRKAFAPYQINRKLVDAAKDGVIVLHCLPAHRGDEITDEIMDDDKISAVFDQAENRMHIYRALYTLLLGIKA